MNINIDFDDASKKWRSNKKSFGDGTFEYKKIRCNFLIKKKNGKNINTVIRCKNKIDFSKTYCHCHSKFKQN